MKLNKKISILSLLLITLFSCQTINSFSSTSQDSLTSSSSTSLNQTSKNSSSTQTKIQTFTDTEKKDLLNCFNLEIPFLNVGNKTNYKLEVENLFSKYGYNKATYTIYNVNTSTYNQYLNKLKENGFTYKRSYNDNGSYNIYSKGGSHIEINLNSLKKTVTMYIYGDNKNNLINANKGLPKGQDVYNVDFTKAKYVKDVSDQGDYLGGCPTTGNVNVLVLPIEFSDKKASANGYSIENIKTAFNGKKASSNLKYPSVSEFYNTSSYGKLNLNFDVLDKWYSPSKNSSYYIEMSENQNPDQIIINEILKKLINEGKNLSKYDSDNNGIIDAIVVINTLDINYDVTLQWAYRYWNYSYADVKYDGLYMKDYLWSSYNFLKETSDGFNGTPNNTYTFIHEFGHVLGADDYYDTSYVNNPNNNSPLDGRDVMDSDFGDHNPFTKFNYGWLTKSRLITTETSTTVTLDDFSKAGDSIIIANNWDDDLGAYQEYYVLMYFKNTGLNEDSNYFSYQGVVMYHVDSSLYEFIEQNQKYYSVRNNNTFYGENAKPNYLIELVSSGSKIVYQTNAESSKNIIDNQGNKISYYFKVNSLGSTSAQLTFTKNK